MLNASLCPIAARESGELMEAAERGEREALLPHGYTNHSLRRGGAAHAFPAGVPIQATKKHTWKSGTVVLNLGSLLPPATSLTAQCFQQRQILKGENRPCIVQQRLPSATPLLLAVRLLSLSCTFSLTDCASHNSLSLANFIVKHKTYACIHVYVLLVRNSA